jgi:putative spermidine/putrescine transport system permease protein
LTAAGNPAVAGVGRPIAGGRRLSLTWVGAVPFLGYVSVFLFLPTIIIAAGAFLSDSGLTLSNFGNLSRSYIVSATINSLILSGVTAVVGAALGAVLSYAIATGNPNGVLRRAAVSASGVLAQFGGVTLAFAALASIGPAGIVYLWMAQHNLDFYSSGTWLYDLRGLEVVYLYFQIPLMVLVFLPAVDGIRPQWREATESLGGNTWHYWRYVAGPLLAPAFLGATLLLFANSLSAYATAAALINQGGIILPLQISNAITSEVGLHEPGFAKAQAVVLIAIVAIVTVLYAVLQRRTGKWLQ